MLQKILFIDRDGTIIDEPKSDFQIDSLEKLQFLPGAITALHRIRKELQFKLVMVTNQDGLGTSSFPEDTFWPAHNKMLQTLAGEGVIFDAIHIDKTFEAENAPTRKPNTGMLTEYFDTTKYDLKNSYVIGDRKTDIKLAQNLGAKAIFIGETPDNEAELTTTNWHQIFSFLSLKDRIASVHRKTNETDIKLNINLDGTGKTSIHTGLSFFDHMIDQLGRHSGTDIDLHVEGDLHVDEHHTIEDTAIAIGEAFAQALGNKKGIQRYGFLLPMDDCLAQVAIDFGGRPWIEWDAVYTREKVGDMPTEMFYHFFKSFSDSAKCNLNIKVEGDNEHHKIESTFKALAKAIKMAKQRDPENMALPSTKGVL